MDSSRRAVEAYWRSRLIDGVTSDEDKVAPVYKLEEVSELLRSSHAGIVKEVSDYILKRLDHKSPVVKQKALRLIKFAVGKSGVEFRREMQRHSAAVRQLSHYKGHPDPLKGDALNKAVRETANETVTAIFASEENKPAPTEGIGNRIEGFGNTSFSRSMEDKKSFISEVVDMGKTSILQGLSNFAAANSMGNDENGNYGSYKSPNLRRSLTSESGGHDKYERNSGGWSSSGVSNNSSSVIWGQDSVQRNVAAASSNVEDGPSHTPSKSREERLLETIVTPGGVRLQPTRDAIQVFLVEASKLNPLVMCHAIESKLQSNLWQIRMKAICVLESIVRRKDDENFLVIISYFSENNEHVRKCAEAPQVSLREKASKVLSLLEGENSSGVTSHPGETTTSKDVAVPPLLSDLIDTGDPVDYGSEDSGAKHLNIDNLELKPTGILIDDLFSSESTTITAINKSNAEEDPFADVSFHSSEDKNHANDLFSGLVIDEKSGDQINKPSINEASDLSNMFNSHVDQQAKKKADAPDLLAALSVNETPVKNKQVGGDAFAFVAANSLPNYPTSEAFAGGLGSQMMGMNPNIFAQPVYQIPQSIMLNQAFAPQAVNYGAMNNFAAQQIQYQNLGNFGSGFSHPSVNANDGNHASVLPDIFRPTSNPVQSFSTTLSSSKKETKAFDFISDHVSAARGGKRVV